MPCAPSGVSTANALSSDESGAAVPLGHRATGSPDSSWSDAERLRYWWSAERERLHAALNAVPAEVADDPLAEGAWSPRGIAAHRLFWEAEERAALEQYLGGGIPSLLEFPVERIDPTNASAVEALGERSLARCSGRCPGCESGLANWWSEFPIPISIRTAIRRGSCSEWRWSMIANIGRSSNAPFHGCWDRKNPRRNDRSLTEWPDRGASYDPDPRTPHRHRRPRRR